MNEDTKPQNPAAKSKTDLRRGQFTPGIGKMEKKVAPRTIAATSRDEEALLFGESPEADSGTTSV